MELGKEFGGELLVPGDAGFGEAALAHLWNELRPARLPEMIARPSSVADVQLAIRFARANGLRVTVRGGGHNWACPSLPEGGLLLDLSSLPQSVEVDAAGMRAVTGPIISNRDMQRALEPFGLAYPTGHCPEVKLSGYLLSGGMAWNHGVWGPGCGSVEAIELVDANGDLRIASEDENQELFWAARGAGPGFFAVAVRYHLRLYPRPLAIVCSSYTFPARCAVEIAEWLGPLANLLTPNVELSLFMVTAPTSLAEQPAGENGKVCMVTATVFADSMEEARDALAPLEECPHVDRCLSRTFAESSSFDEIFDLSGSLWPGGLRCIIDAMFSNSALSEVTFATIEHFIQCPSPETVFMFAVFTGGSAPAVPADAAFSATGRLYGGPWTMWRNASDDAVNRNWHDRCVELMLPYVHAHYIAESDTGVHPEFIARSYSPENYRKLTQLRSKYDPDRLFHSLLDTEDVSS